MLESLGTIPLHKNGIVYAIIKYGSKFFLCRLLNITVVVFFISFARINPLKKQVFNEL